MNESKDFSALAEEDKNRLAENVSRIALEWIHYTLYWDADVSRMLVNLRSVMPGFKEVQVSQDSNEQGEKDRLPGLWKSLADTCDVFNTQFAKPSYIPVRELQFFENIKKIDLSKMKLNDSDIHEIESFCSPEKLEDLDLSDNKFTKIPKFTQFESLQSVHMLRCPVDTLTAERYKTDDCIAKCEALEYMAISYSDIQSIETGFFEAFPSLESLNLCSTRVTDISMLDDEFFETHPKITEIDLYSCQVTKFPAKISKVNKKKLSNVIWSN